MDFILVSEYGANGDNPEIVIYKKRKIIKRLKHN